MPKLRMMSETTYLDNLQVLRSFYQMWGIHSKESVDKGVEGSLGRRHTNSSLRSYFSSLIIWIKCDISPPLLVLERWSPVSLWSVVCGLWKAESWKLKLKEKVTATQPIRKYPPTQRQTHDARRTHRAKGSLKRWMMIVNRILLLLPASCPSSLSPSLNVSPSLQVAWRPSDQKACRSHSDTRYRRDCEREDQLW